MIVNEDPPDGFDEKGLDVKPASESPRLSSTVTSSRDDNYETYTQHVGEEYDPVLARKVLRKIDLRLMPVLFLLYLLQYLDKNGINYASAYGLQKGTHLHGQDYSWLSSVRRRPHSIRRSCGGEDS